MTTAAATRFARVSLETTAAAFSVDVQRTAAKVLQRPVAMHGMKFEDHVRLLTLRTWCQQYQITLDYALRVLLSIRPPFKSKRTPTGLGVRVSTLTCAKYKAILAEAVAKDYPHGEHLQMLRNRLEEDVLLSTDLMGSESGYRVNDPIGFVRAYKTRIRQARAQLQSFQTKLSRRPWRGNPYR